MTKKQIIVRWVLVIALFFLGILSCLNLRLNDNALDLLPSQSVKGNIQLLQDMGLVDRVFITLSVTERFKKSGADAKTVLKQSSEQLGSFMKESGLFSFVLAKLPQGYEYSLFNTLRSSLPFLLDQEDYEELAILTSKEGVKEGLRKSFMLLNSPAGIALKKHVQLDPLALVPRVMAKLNHLRSEFSMQLDDGVFFSSDGTSVLIIAQSKYSLTDSVEALKVQTILERGYVEALDEGVEARVIGSLPHTLANSSIIQKDLRLLLPLASLLLLLLLGWTLRDIRALVVLAVPFLAAPLAVGLTSLIYGELSGLALGFGIVLLGIGVDFSIHLFWTLTKEDGETNDLLQQIKRPIIYATLTTSTVFVVLLFSSVVSHKQMALLALLGVLLAVCFAWLLIPTIVASKRVENGKNRSLQIFRETNRMYSYPRIIVSIWLIVLAFGVYTWPQLHYNGDLRELDVPDAQVKKDENHFSTTWGEKGEQAFVIVTADNLESVLDKNSIVFDALDKHNNIKFQSFAPIIPGPGKQGENYRLWEKFWEDRRDRFDSDFSQIATDIGFRSDAFTPFFLWLDSTPLQLEPDAFLGGPLEPMFNTMLVEKADEKNPQGRYLVMTTVALNQPALIVLDELESTLDGVTVLNNRKWRKEVEGQMKHDIMVLSCAAGLAILFIVFLQFKKITATIAVLAPVLTALSGMSIFCYLTHRDLNMMHLIMGIMVIGLSVDYGIFIVCSKQSKATSIASEAVSICAASSLIGFGVLACASHPALYALGTTVLVGIGVAWPTALIVSPSILNCIGKR